MSEANVTPKPVAEEPAVSESGGPGSMPAPAPSTLPPPELYKGLSYFEPKDQASFTGRETDIVEIVARLTISRALVLYGRSGLGKTSLVLAGIFPRLKRLRYRPVCANPGGSAGRFDPCHSAEICFPIESRPQAG